MDVHDQLREEIEATKVQFHALLAKIPDRCLTMPSDNPAWTIGEVVYHMSVAPRLLIQDVKMFTHERWWLRFVPLFMPTWLFHWLNERLTRYAARNCTRQSLGDAYDRAHEITLEALAAVADADFANEINYPDWDPLLSGPVTLERLFHYVNVHFESHAREIERLIADC